MSLPRAYHMGREALQAGKPKSAPSTLSTIMRFWWLAGWNDADMEREKCQQR